MMTAATGNNSNNNTKSGQNKKRARQPRFAFMTKSDVDHLEDGYRWRKYGQKAVKNSPFPRYISSQITLPPIHYFDRA
jgi:hypothetical protein